MQAEIRGREVIEDVVHARRVPHRIGVVRERIGAIRALARIHLRRRWNRRRGVVIGVDERQQIPIGMHRALVDRARALLVSRGLVVAAGDEHHRRVDAFQSLRIPIAALHAPRPDCDRRLDAWIARLLILGIRGTALRQHLVRRRLPGRRARGGVAAADHVDNAVAAHRVADDAGARRVDETGEEAARSRLAEAIDLVQHEQLIERAVVERAAERLLIVVGAVLVIDRDGDEALARQVLAHVRHQKAIAGIAVRNDDEWIAAAGFRLASRTALP